MDETKVEYTERVGRLTPSNKDLDEGILKFAKEKREDTVFVMNEEKEKDKKLV